MTKNLTTTFEPESHSDFGVHPEYAEVFRRWTTGDPSRGQDFARIWGMILNCKHVLNKCDGDVAELGVYKGNSAALLSFYAKKFGRKMFLCDTFNGFDVRQFEDNMQENVQTAFRDVSLDEVRSLVGDYRGNRWIIGTFPDSITREMSDAKFAWVSIDCDIYEPIKRGLEFFWPRMSHGGMIFVHDYSSGYWPGATRAVDEFCAKNAVAGCLLPDLSGTFILTRC